MGWHKTFKERREEIDDNSRCEKLSTSRTVVSAERVKQAMRSYRWSTVRMVACQLDMKKDRLWKFVSEDLCMRKVYAKMVSNLLKDYQKECRMQVCQEISERLQTETDLLRSAITGEWISGTTRKTSARSVSGSLRCRRGRKTQEVKCQSHVDHVLRCERHRPH